MPENQFGYKDRQDLIRELKLRLGDGMVDVELDREHYDVCIDQAIGKYRQLSSGSVEESIVFIQTQPGVTEYVLPAEVIEVQRLYRRGVGTNNGSGSNFDPFDAAFVNMYMLQPGRAGGLALFDAFSQYKETVGRLFGSEYNFLWNRNTKALRILRNVQINEDVAVGVYNYIPEQQLLVDVYASQWISAYSLANAKMLLGEARGKYTSGLPGAGGAVQLNGAELKAEALSEMENLKTALHNMEEGNSPLGFIIG
jgi:hypothetical protein